MSYDFSGYVTKNDVKCSDGVTIKKDAFLAQDGEIVPMVWKHLHDSPDNVLGHIKLENRPDGVYGYGVFNDTPKGQNAKQLVAHGDVNSMSIWANNLTKIGSDIMHGEIREVSLVLAGANPQAKIDKIFISHGDGTGDEADDEAIISMNIPFDNGNIAHEASDKTIGEVLDTLNEDQQAAVAAMTTQVIKMISDGEIKQSADEGGNEMAVHLFDNTAKQETDKSVIAHDAMQKLNQLAKDNKASLKETVIAHAKEYGVTNIEELFPDAKNITQWPEFIKRDTGWVAGVLNGVKHSPFARIKMMTADITADEARAKGYITGNFKKEEYFGVSGRVTAPTTIYKKQKFDRDDLIDVEGDIVPWIKAEMRMMLDEELARAIVIGDGRPLEVGGKVNEDKIDENCIRPIWTDAELYAMHCNIMNGVATGGDATNLDIYEGMLDNVIRAMDDYEGSGNTVMFANPSDITEILLLKDQLGRRLFESVTSLASYMGVDKIVKMPQLKQTQTRTATSTNTGKNETTGTQYDLFGIIVDLKDYTVGADKGGQVTMFDGFDIDYNQFKYLLETRVSGSLTKPHSAIILEKPHTSIIG